MGERRLRAGKKQFGGFAALREVERADRMHPMGQGEVLWFFLWFKEEKGRVSRGGAEAQRKDGLGGACAHGEEILAAWRLYAR